MEEVASSARSRRTSTSSEIFYFLSYLFKKVLGYCCKLSRNQYLFYESESASQNSREGILYTAGIRDLTRKLSTEEITEI